MPSYATESGVPLTFFVMYMVSVDALSQCNNACHYLVGEVLHFVASSSEGGAVLLMRVDENGMRSQHVQCQRKI